MILLKNTELYVPENLGRMDILIFNDRILKIEREIPTEVVKNLGGKAIDTMGAICVPGFMDGHVHLIGGGGEGGFNTRTTPGGAEDFLKNGTTTVVGLLGTDGITRDHIDLLARARSLKTVGIDSYIMTGSYRYPVKTITGDVMKDIILMDEVLGVGELAVSDHRGSDINGKELQRLAMDVRVGGMLSGKKGVLVIHMGDAPTGLKPLFDAVEDGVLPSNHLLPTHISRTPALLEEGKKWIKEKNGYIDFTASNRVPALLADFYNEGIPFDRITVSSDGFGSLPVFNEKKELVSINTGPVDSLYKNFKSMVSDFKIPLENALLPFTKNVASFFGLQSRSSGSLLEGGKASLILFSPTSMNIETVIAGGKVFKD